jgi:hypothetical protein
MKTSVIRTFWEENGALDWSGARVIIKTVIFEQFSSF